MQIHNLDFIFQNNLVDIFCCVKGSSKKKKEEGVLRKFFKHIYGPALLSKVVRPIVIFIFFGFFAYSISVYPKIEIGLDQQLSMPRDSYMQKYFTVSINLIFRFEGKLLYYFILKMHKI